MRRSLQETKSSRLENGPPRMGPVTLAVIAPDGRVTTRRLALEEAIEIGRDPACGLTIDDDEVSRRHLRLEVRAGAMTVTDLGAHNGTAVDDLPLEPGVPKAVVEGQRIRAGRSWVIIVSGHPAAPRKRAAEPDASGIVAVDAKTVALVSVIQKVAPTEAPILLGGRSGVGKEAFVREIHRLSRPGGPFVAVNCGALPPALVGSELFGHERGAFTGAEAPRAGAFEQADGGTLFLDELGELPLKDQPVLLRVLEDMRVKRIGGAVERPVDVRIVAATNRDLEQQIAAGAFREDLYFRLAVVTLAIPTLVERRDDILPLARRFLDAESRKRGVRLRLSAAAERRLVGHPFPGNVRELRNLIVRAAALAEGEELGDELFAARPSVAPPPIQPLPRGARRKEQIDAATERATIERALSMTGGSQARAAALLGISVRTLTHRLNEHGDLPRPRKR